MRLTIKRLMAGDSLVANNFSQSKVLWAELLGDVDEVDVATLAKRLNHAQDAFGSLGGADRDVGKEVLAWTGFAYLFNVSDGDESYSKRGTKLLKAFNLSGCSTEVVHEASEAAGIFWIE